MSKPTATAKQATASKGSTSSSAWFAPAVIIGSLIVAEIVFHTVMGNPGNFENNDPVRGHPIGGNMLGTIYKGGFIVPILMTLFLCVVIFSIERYLTINAAQGKGSLPDFLKRVKAALESNNVDSAIAECDKQRGSVANVVRSGLVKYKEMVGTTDMDRDQKVAAIQQEIEESTALEMPMLERNMPILSTIGSIGTLIALLGTVIGMIKAFSALASSGAPDAVALSTGISEALINTALGIGTSAFAIIFYNYFTAKIDALSYRIDEAAFSMTQSFVAHNK
ncbi:MAG: MotA/TolQ/ExbB proton channel family protein [Saprospiraceae bacterium]|nr:MotA/TolQ/ExbB proton channel family protein [Saprospiraceae bacterium]